MAWGEGILRCTGGGQIGWIVSDWAAWQKGVVGMEMCEVFLWKLVNMLPLSASS